MKPNNPPELPSPGAAARFHSRVNRDGPIVRPELGACWLWTGKPDTAGYGHFVIAGRSKIAHRVAWAIEHEKWPSECALHKCDNRRCVRPSHLFEGSKRENNIDRDRKGRAARLKGEANGFARLTEETVRRARELLAGGLSQVKTARALGVHTSTINLMARGRTWRHVA